MSLGQKDRQELNNMHSLANGTGQNASSSSGLHSTPWTKSATRIEIPKEGSTKPRPPSVFAHSLNPFSPESWNDLRGENSTRHNPRAASILQSDHLSRRIGHSNSNRPSVKRRKVENGTNPSARRPTVSGADLELSPLGGGYPKGPLSLNNKFEMTGISGSNRRKSMPAYSSNRHADKGPEFINLASDGEDEDDQQDGKSSSSMTSSEDFHYLSSGGVAESLEVKSILGEKVSEGLNPNAMWRKGPYSHPLPPAPETEKLRKKAGASRTGSDSDPIEEDKAEPETRDFDNMLDDDNAEQFSSLLSPQSNWAPPRKNVKNLVEKYEHKHNSSAQNKPSRISRMRGKSATGNIGVHAFEMGKSSNGAPQFPLQTKWQLSEEVPVEIEAFAANGFMTNGGDTIGFKLVFRKSTICIQRQCKYGGTDIVVEIHPSNVENIMLPTRSLSNTEYAVIVITLKPEVTILYDTPGTPNFPNLPGNKVFVKISTNDVRLSKQIEKKLGGSIAIVYDSNAGKNLWEDLVRDAPDSPLGVTTTKPLQRPRRKPNFMDKSKTEDYSSFFEPHLTRSALLLERRPVERSTPSPPLDELILVYPPTGPGALNLSYGDVKRLDPGEFLNDVLIEFGLKLWLNKLREERSEIAEQVHVFSSFFFTQLNQKNIDEGYLSVRKWTSKFNLFDKNFIIVPINEHLHWYLAIICYPGRTLQRQPKTEGSISNITTRAHGRLSIQTTTTPRGSPPLCRPPNSSGQVSNLTTVQDEKEVEEQVRIIPEHSSTPLLDEGTPPTDDDEPIRILQMCSGDENRTKRMAQTKNKFDAAADHVDTFCNAEEKVSVPISPQKFYKDPKPCRKSESLEESTALVTSEEEIDELDVDDKMEVDILPLTSTEVTEMPKLERPQIFTFDSLGSRHPHVIKVLSRYLELEAKDKKGWEDPVDAQGRAASVPAQPNYCDCGIYLLHFVEQFMSDPEKFIEHILIPKGKKLTVTQAAREELWEHVKVAGRRNKLKQSILTLSAEWKDKTQESKGKRKAKATSEPPAETIANSDSDIEVLEVTQPPVKQPKPQRQKAQRLR